MILRKLGSVLRGKATPFQIVAACVIGSLGGFAPGPSDALALDLLLVALLLVVNANIGLALLVAGGAKLLSLLLVPVSFALGRWLLDGPAEPVARAVVNAPVLAWCGFERYAVAGGQVLGLAVGLAVGLLVARAVSAFRRRMAAAAASPSKVTALAGKPMARFALWLFFGGKGKGTWDEKLARRVGNPVRVWGVALVLALVASAWAADEALAGPLAKRRLQEELEQANGATVDLGVVQLDLQGGRFAVSELALADPSDLGVDLLRAAHLEADLDQADLLKRRFHVSKLVVREASSGAARAVPGVRTAPPAEESAGEGEGPAEPGVWDLDQVLRDYETWKERLEQARRVLEKLGGRGAEGPAPGEEGESYEERIAREVRERGWFAVADEGLVEGAPAFRLSELVVDGLAASWLGGRVLDLRGEELSTDPGLVDGAPRVVLASRDGAIRFEVDLAPASRGGGEGRIGVAWKGIPVEAALAQLRLGEGDAPLRGGVVDLELGGPWRGGRIGEIDLPLTATIRDTTVSVEGVKEAQVSQLVLPIRLSGAIDAPKVHFDQAAFAKALADAGKGELAREVREKLGEKGAEALEKLKEKTGVELPAEVPGDLDGLKKEAEGGAKKLLDGVLKKKGG